MGTARTKEKAVELPEFCRAMVHASPLPSMLVVGRSHTIQYVNSAFRDLLGRPEQELVGATFFKAMPRSTHCLTLLDRVYRTGQTETYTGQEGFDANPFHWSYILWPVISDDDRSLGIMIQVTETTPFHLQTVAVNQALVIGSVRQHELTAAADKLNVQLQCEIIRREQVEKEMEEQQRQIAASERRFRGLIEAIPQIVWTATTRGVLDFSNSKWFDSFGLDLKTFNQQGWPVLLHPDDQNHSLEAWENGLKNKSAFQIEHRLRSLTTGSYRWYLTRAIPLALPGEPIVKWFGTSTDVDDHKRTESAVFARQKLESLGLLAGGVAHDFNNLLCIISGGAGLISESLPASHSLQETVADISQASERAAHLTRQMLAYAGKGKFLIEEVEMNELVRSTCELIETSIPKSVSLTVKTRANLPPVRSDIAHMQQIVMNLVLNAAEAIDESSGGSVLVETDLLELTPLTISEIELITGNLKPGTYVTVKVQDDGVGMSESTKAEILEPFFSTKFTGRGLGLSAVGGILRSQNGSLQVNSSFGEGSTFRVFLPASATPARVRKQPAERRRVRGEGTILVIDDEEMIRKVARLSLEHEGFTVLLASGGEEALRILQIEAESISLILLDLNMPKMSGKQTMESIRSLGIKIPIVICSGYSETEIHREFSGLDIAGMVQKPFTVRQLANCAKSLVHAPAQGGDVQ